MKRKKKDKKPEQHIDAETEFIRHTMCDKQPLTPWQALVEISKGKNISDMFFELSDESQHEILDFLLWELEQPKDQQIAKTWQARVKETRIR